MKAGIIGVDCFLSMTILLFFPVPFTWTSLLTVRLGRGGISEVGEGAGETEGVSTDVALELDRE